ncbi:MAG: inorganic phosphate transporter [Capnocytophaga sp.]|nr:inorganic phosphate transporter [Capnocytophaga sp.]
MEQIYIFTLVVLCVLAIFDLMVGVSNDASNFLNAAVGSKATSLRTIMIVASIGIGIGAVFSNGMMEIAKSGMFNPQMFYFEEVMVIFAAVMLADIILLDFFNYLGLPTSTTVSIVFELLGAAVAVGLIKVLSDPQSSVIVTDYINTAKAGQIVSAIFVSVLLAFTAGSIVQFIARLIFTFHFEKKMSYLSGIFGGISLTALIYFLVIKGLKGVSFVSKDLLYWIDNNTLVIIACFIVFFSILSQLLYVAKVNIFKVVVLAGTFALAMAFAGNDLVNFIGVPIAAWDSFNLWTAAGSPENSFVMSGLLDGGQTPQYFLFISGGVMILTLWFSKSARNVIETGVNLSRQDESKEKFEANAISRIVVRFSVWVANAVEKIIPRSVLKKIDERFQKPEEKPGKDKPAFDLVRASVNLVVSSSLIALGTSLKLPLSTTYVAFMVAMGASLADRAWGRESAVFRVAGVFNVIGGWFLTAGAAFVMAFITAMILYYGEIYGLIGMVLLVGFLLMRNSIAYKRKEAKNKEAQSRQFNREDLININGIMRMSSQNIAGAVQQLNEIYTGVIDNLAVENLKELKANKKKAKALSAEIEDLKSGIYYFIKSVDNGSVESIKFYILILDYLYSMANSIVFIADNSYTHVNNNHKKLKYNHIRNLKQISERMESQFGKILEILNISMYSNSITKLIEEEHSIKDQISALIEKQIFDIRSAEGSPKNTKLYFNILLETKVLTRTIIFLMQLFKDFKDQYKKVS